MPEEAFPLPAAQAAPTALACKANQGFDGLPEGWTIKNTSNPRGTQTWFQGNGSVFQAHSGASNSYIGANYDSTTQGGTISNWLITPVMTFQNGDVVRFFTRTVDNSAHADRLQLRLSTAGSDTILPTTSASVGSFTTLLLDINPTYSLTGYPDTWTEFSVVLGGLGWAVQGQIAFRYYIENGGLGGANSNYIGIDSFSICRQTSIKPGCTLGEGFTTVIPPLWANINRSNPIGVKTWGKGSPSAFPDQTGVLSNYAAASYESAGGQGTISNWLFSPLMTFRNGESFQFYTRTVSLPAFADRMQVRLSTNLDSTYVGPDANSVGDFSTLLLDINPTLVPTNYPSTWTPYTLTLSGLPNLTAGRLAFRYYVTDGGLGGTNSDYIGVDTVSMCDDTIDIFSINLPIVMR